MRSHVKAPLARSIWIVAVSAFVASLLLLALVSASASAAIGHSVLRTFSTGPNTEPGSIATDSSGNVYVLELGSQRIDKFSAAGNRASFAGSAPYVGEASLTGTSGGPFNIATFIGAGLAVDRSGGPSDGDIYLAMTDNNFVSSTFVFGSTGLFRGAMRGVQSRACGAAINQATGEVYVGAPELTRRFPPPAGNPDGTEPSGQFGFGRCNEAVDSTGAVYAPLGTQVWKYKASGEVVEIPSTGQALAVDPSNDDLYADDGSHITRLNSAGALQDSPFGDLASSSGVTIAANGEILATDSGGGVFVYGPSEVQLATATTGGSSNVTAESAEVEGSVDPDGAGDVTSCEIRYGEDSGYANGAVPCSPGGTISIPTAVSATLTGLVSGTTYHYRVFATNANGTQMASSEQTFTTTSGAVEGVTTEAAGAVRKDAATLNGSFSGDGQEAHYFFEWGRTTAYGHTTPVPPGDAGTATGPQSVAPITISGLEGNASYHYRLVVSTASGITRGQDESFTTPDAVTNLSADPVTGLTDTSAELHGSFDGDGTYETHYFFEWGASAKYGNVIPVSPGSIPASTGRLDLPAATISGLERGATYHYRVVASNAAGTTFSADASFKTAEAPLVFNLSTRKVTATGAELSAEVNPRSADTTYRFEWGQTSTYGNTTPTPDGNLGSGNGAIPVSAQLSGLTPGVTYHFRAVATNQYGTTRSPDQTFGFYPPNCPNAQIRQETRSNDLPDCRAYELVTPSFQNGAVIVPVNAPLPNYSTNPSKIAYSVNFGTFSDEGQANGSGDLHVSTRTASGWYQKYVGLPVTDSLVTAGPPLDWTSAWQLGARTGIAVNSFYGTQASSNLDRVIVYANGWANDHEGQLGKLSNAPYLFNTDTGARLGRWPTNLSQIPGGEGFVGVPQASPDFSHFIFSSNVIFSDDGRGQASSKSIQCCSADENTNPMPKGPVYDNDISTGAVNLVSLKSDNVTEFEGNVYHVSDDGSHILMGVGSRPFMDKGAPINLTGPFYLRVADERTYEIAPGRQLRYVGSTADGETVYFTSPEQLTADDHDSSADLYMWNQDQPSQLTLVSAGGGAGNSDSCNTSWVERCGVGIINFFPYGSLIQGGQYTTGGRGDSDNFIASESGDIYFESPEQLVGAKGEPNQVNLYLYRNGSLRYVTTMSPDHNCGASGCSDGPVARMQVTPSGNHMAFVTNSNVTDYDSHFFREMYTYDPQSGQIVCVSCRPDGEAPTADTLASLNGLFLTNDGRAFFSTVDALVPRDSGGVRDVYEFTEGKAQLISAGIGIDSPVGTLSVEGRVVQAGLVGVSADGTDVYFTTADTLVSQDHNGAQLKMYDARTGGGFPAEVTPPNCEAADECHGPSSIAPALPPDRTSASLGARHQKKKAAKHDKKAKKHHKAKRHKQGKRAKNRRAAKAKGRSHRG